MQILEHDTWWSGKHSKLHFSPYEGDSLPLEIPDPIRGLGGKNRTCTSSIQDSSTTTILHPDKKSVAVLPVKLQWLIFSLDHRLASNQHLNEMERDKGIEPLTHACKAHVFPLAPTPHKTWRRSLPRRFRFPLSFMHQQLLTERLMRLELRHKLGDVGRNRTYLPKPLGYSQLPYH